MESEIIKRRSISSCIKAAYILYITNVKSLFLRTWVWILVCAIGLTAILFEFTSIEPFVKPDHLFSWIEVLLLIGTVIAVIGYIETFTRLFSLINSQKLSYNRRRVGNVLITAILISVTTTIIFYILGLLIFLNKQAIMKGDISSLYKSVCFVAMCLFLFYLIMLPIIYSFMKYIMEPNEKLWLKMVHNLKTGMRHWGYIFTTIFVSGLITSVIELIVLFPTFILSNAQISSAIGVINGDASGLPSHFNLLVIIVFTICIFLCLFIGLWQTVVVYYLYGSIEGQEKLRMKNKNEGLN